MTDTGIPPIAFLVFALALAGTLSLLSCRALLRSPRLQALPRPVMCALLWATPSALFLIASLPIARHPSDFLGISILIPVIALVGLAFGGVFRLLARVGATGHWFQRTLVGGLLGLVIAVVCGALLHHFLTGWGGPGGGSFRRTSGFDASLAFSWLVPLVAVLGVATPLKALMPRPRSY